MKDEVREFDYRNVLVNGKEYECGRDKEGRIYLFCVECSIKKQMFAFDDKEHEGYLSNQSYFETPYNMTLEVVSIDFVNFKTGYTVFTGRISYDCVMPGEYAHKVISPQFCNTRTGKFKEDK